MKRQQFALLILLFLFLFSIYNVSQLSQTRWFENVPDAAALGVVLARPSNGLDGFFVVEHQNQEEEKLLLCGSTFKTSTAKTQNIFSFKISDLIFSPNEH